MKLKLDMNGNAVGVNSFVAFDKRRSGVIVEIVWGIGDWFAKIQTRSGVFGRYLKKVSVIR